MWKWYVGTTWYNNTINHPWLGMVYTTYIYGDDWGWFSILPTWWICWSPPRVILTDFWKNRCSFPWSVRWDFREIPIIRQGKTLFLASFSSNESPEAAAWSSRTFFGRRSSKMPMESPFFFHMWKPAIHGIWDGFWMFIPLFLCVFLRVWSIPKWAVFFNCLAL